MNGSVAKGSSERAYYGSISAESRFRDNWREQSDYLFAFYDERSDKASLHVNNNNIVKGNCTES